MHTTSLSRSPSRTIDGSPFGVSSAARRSPPVSSGPTCRTVRKTSDAVAGLAETSIAEEVVAVPAHGRLKPSSLPERCSTKSTSITRPSLFDLVANLRRVSHARAV
eukprot:1116860-Prymnesium_polylepis.1